MTLACVALLTIIGALVATPATMHAASPGTYNGYYPSQVSGCSSSIRAENNTVSIYSPSTYYGWAEQRYSSSGDCSGYQWIRLHVTNTMSMIDKDFTAWEYEVGVTNYIPIWSITNGYLAPGTYDLQMLYVTSHRICAYISSVNYNEGGYFFGHGYSPSNDDGYGNWCA